MTRITEVWWGVPGNLRDHTEKARELHERDGTTQFTADIHFFGDPDPKSLKTLVMTWETNGKRSCDVVWARDGRAISIPEAFTTGTIAPTAIPQPPDSTSKAIKAKYPRLLGGR